MNSTRAAITLALTGVLIVAFSQVRLPTIGTPSTTTNAPSAELQVMVAPIKSLAAGKPLAPKLGHWYRDAASVVRVDKKLRTTEQARQWLIDVDTIAITGTDVVGSVPGFGDAKNKVVTEAMGLVNTELDDTRRTRLADTLDAIGWALGG